MEKNQKLIGGFLNGDRRGRERTQPQRAWLLMVPTLLPVEFSQGEECRIVFDNCQIVPACAKSVINRAEVRSLSPPILF